MTAVPKVSPHRGGTRVLAMAAGLVAVGLLASGCVRVNATLSVSSTDLVSGDVVIAAQPSAQNGAPQLAIPAGMASRVRTQPYSADGYVGSDVTFQNLSFEEMTAFAAAITSQSGYYHITFQRQGDIVTMSGSADLSQLVVPGVDVRLRITFPGPVTQSTGGIDGQTVSWTMKAGQVNQFSATVQYAIGNSHSWQFWVLTLSGGMAVISAFLVLLALLARRRHLKKENAYAAATAGPVY
jgi:hypothetical protein